MLIIQGKFYLSKRWAILLLIFVELLINDFPSE